MYTGEEYAKEINRAKIFINAEQSIATRLPSTLKQARLQYPAHGKGQQGLERTWLYKRPKLRGGTDDNFYDLAMYYLKTIRKEKG